MVMVKTDCVYGAVLNGLRYFEGERRKGSKCGKGDFEESSSEVPEVVPSGAGNPRDGIEAWSY